uniref:Uncharacterized protein n=1 Tax=Lepeophtheirus salmonis TaxID=72036 RepID=A0A0K2TSN9_LEPSM
MTYTWRHPLFSPSFFDQLKSTFLFIEYLQNKRRNLNKTDVKINP